jgi:drug/metabolite transporter (DMT)-like permease
MAILTIPLFFILNIQPLTPFQLLIVVIKSILVALFFLFSAQALRHLDVSEYSPLTNLSPIILVFFGLFLLNERLNTIHVVGILVTVIGAYILELGDGFLSPLIRIKNNKHIHHLIYGLLFGAACATLDKFALNGIIKTPEFFVYQRFFIAIILFGIITVMYDGYKDIVKVFKERPIITGLSAILFMLADWFYFLAVAIPSSMISLVITIKRAGTLIPTITGGEFFKEKHILKKSLACLVMLVGIYLVLK